MITHEEAVGNMRKETIVAIDQVDPTRHWDSQWRQMDKDTDRLLTDQEL